MVIVLYLKYTMYIVQVLLLLIHLTLFIKGMDNVSMVAANKNDEVIKAAKSLFSKRTRTLYHWLYPNTSKNKIKAIVSATWDTLSDSEKHFYISQVLLICYDL